RRDVPGRDRPDDPERFPDQVVGLTAEVPEALAREQPRRSLAVVLDELDRLRDVSVGLAPRFARLVNDPGGELLPLPAQPLRDLTQKPSALGGAAVAPPGK